MSRDLSQRSSGSNPNTPAGWRAVVVLAAVFVTAATGELLHWALVLLLFWVGKAVVAALSERRRGG